MNTERASLISGAYFPEPLYQVYVSRTLRRERNMSRKASSSSSTSADVSLDDLTRGTLRNMRMLWCELPEVTLLDMCMYMCVCVCVCVCVWVWERERERERERGRGGRGKERKIDMKEGRKNEGTVESDYRSLKLWSQVKACGILDTMGSDERKRQEVSVVWRTHRSSDEELKTIHFE